MSHGRRKLAAAAVAALTMAGCGQVPGQNNTPGTGNGPSQSPAPSAAAFAQLNTTLVKGVKSVKLSSPKQHVSAELPDVPASTAYNLGLQIVPNRLLRDFNKATGKNFQMSWALTAASDSVLGVVLTANLTDSSGKTTSVPTTVWYDRASRHVYTAPALVEPTSWDAFTAEVGKAVTAAGGDQAKAAAALAESPAPLGDGPAIGFNQQGDLVVAFRSGQVGDSVVTVKVPVDVAEPMLSVVGRKAKGASTHPSTYDPSSAIAATTGASAKAVATRPSADVVPDCKKLKCVSLTFDDGPGPRTKEVVDALIKKGAGATFFQLGDSIQADPDGVRYAAGSGNEVGSHTWRHDSLTGKSDEGDAYQLSRNIQALQAITGDRPIMMRPPYGNHSARVDRVIGRYGQVICIWDVDTLDWKTKSTPATVASATSAKPGSVVLMHDIHDSTVDAVPQIIADLQSAGFTILPMSELASPSDWGVGKYYCAAPSLKVECGVWG